MHERCDTLEGCKEMVSLICGGKKAWKEESEINLIQALLLLKKNLIVLSWEFLRWRENAGTDTSAESVLG